eukprot:5377925-Prymnesium_polylepis.1
MVAPQGCMQQKGGAACARTQTCGFDVRGGLSARLRARGRYPAPARGAYFRGEGEEDGVWGGWCGVDGRFFPRDLSRVRDFSRALSLSRALQRCGG